MLAAHLLGGRQQQWGTRLGMPGTHALPPLACVCVQSMIRFRSQLGCHIQAAQVGLQRTPLAWEHSLLLLLPHLLLLLQLHLLLPAASASAATSAASASAAAAAACCDCSHDYLQPLRLLAAAATLHCRNPRWRQHLGPARGALTPVHAGRQRPPKAHRGHGVRGGALRRRIRLPNSMAAQVFLGGGRSGAGAATIPPGPTPV